MEESAVSINRNPSISLSRNSPVALVVGAAGFLGSYVSEKLLDRGIQVIGVDNFISGSKSNIEECIKNKKFHLINKSISELEPLKLLRLDYAFFLADVPAKAMLAAEREGLYKKGLSNFLEVIKEFNPKIAFVSSIDLYGNSLSGEMEVLKRGEILLAKSAKDHNLNARVIRLASVFGPRMNFGSEDPVSRLIQASLLGELQKEQTSLDFSTRSLFVSDAVELVVKSVFYGGTAHKIYDGVQIDPIKVVEIKQILLDPLWYEDRGFKPTEIPPWPTPNLKKTIKELSFKPKTNIVKALKETISFFKDNSRHVPRLGLEELEKEAKVWVKEEPKVEESHEEKAIVKKEEDKREGRLKQVGGKLSKKWWIYLGIAVIIYALGLPIFQIVFGAFNSISHLQVAGDEIKRGEFKKAEDELRVSQDSLANLREIVNSLSVFNQVPRVGQVTGIADHLLLQIQQGVDGASKGAAGSEALFQITKIISGEKTDDPKKYFDEASLNFSSAQSELSDVLAKMTDQRMPWISDFTQKLEFYSGLVEKGRVASNILPQVIEGKKSYLVLFQDNFELRGTGGFIPALARLDFEDGHIKTIKVDSTLSLDQSFKEPIEPPPLLKSDLGKSDWRLEDIGFDPDFPTAAKRAEFLYGKEALSRVNGVIALDLEGTRELLKAVDGVDIPDYSEHVGFDNFNEKITQHATDLSSVSSSKNYLVSLENALFNKIFFLSNQNWPAVIGALDGALAEKHLLLYFDDPNLISLALSENWAGSLPRPGANQVGITADFLGLVETNVGRNLANYYTKRDFNLKTSINDTGQVFHHLEVKIKNSSESSDFPGGVYKDRVRIYLPTGAKLTKASLGSEDILSGVTSFSDYSRAGYSVLVSILPKEEKILALDYQLSTPLNFKEGDHEQTTNYQLEIYKQPGTGSDPFNWNITFPTTFKPTLVNNQPVTSAKQELNLTTDLSVDRLLTVGFSK